MKGLWQSLLAGIIITLFVVFVGYVFAKEAMGFDVTKYLGLQPLLGTPGEVNPGNVLFPPVTTVNTICGIFTSIQWSTQDLTPVQTTTVNGVKIDTFKSPACSSGVPVSCFTTPDISKIDESSGEQYGDDYIFSIYNDVDNTCVVQAKEGYFKKGQARMVGVLCASLGSSDVEYNWGPWETTQSIGKGVTCDPGFVAVSGMVRSNSLTSDDVKAVISNISQWSALLNDPNGNPGTYKKQFGVVCLSSAIFNRCGMHVYNFSEAENYKKWWSNGVDDRDENQEGNFIEEPCPGDSQLISCGGGNKNPSEYTGLGSLYDSSVLSDGKGNGFNIQTCQIEHIGSIDESSTDEGIVAVCAQNLWKWGNWTKSSFISSTFSIDCDAGTEAIACASDTASLESGWNVIGSWLSNPGGRKYGDAAMNGITFLPNNAGCKIYSEDENENPPGIGNQKRRVGALCINSNTFSSDFTYAGDQAFVHSSGNTYQTFGSPACPSNYLPVFCTVKMDSSGNYHKDTINEIDVDTSVRTCNVTIADANGAGFKGTIGALCAKQGKVTIDNDWNSIPYSPILGTTNEVEDLENPFFNSTTCDFGIATTALTVSNSGKYQEPFLMSMVPTSTDDGFVVQAEDTIGTPGAAGNGNSHMRKVGDICVNYKAKDFQISSSKPPASSCAGLGLGTSAGCLSTANCPNGNGVHCINPFDCSGTAPCCCVPLTTPSTCGNGVCESGENCGNCPYDCGCSNGQTCQSNACVTQPPASSCTDLGLGTSAGCDITNDCTSVGGHCTTNRFDCTGGTANCCCVPSSTPQTCGNGVCESGENCGNCPYDCGCPLGQTCQSNACKASSTCGQVGYPCCSGSTPCGGNPSLVCDESLNSCQVCGGTGNDCCSGNTCNAGLTCAATGKCQPSWSFSLSLNPSSSTYTPGTPFSPTVQITVTTISGTPTQPVSFSYSISPTGPTITAAPACTPSTTYPYQCTSQFTVHLGSGASGTYLVTVNGFSTGGNQAAFATYTLTASTAPTECEINGGGCVSNTPTCIAMGGTCQPYAGCSGCCCVGGP